MYLELLRRLDDKKFSAWEKFLNRAGLHSDSDVSQTVLVWENKELIATGSRTGNLLKCIAVDKNHQGEDLTAVVLSKLRQEAFEEGHRHLFLYTKPENEALFTSLFFYPVAKTKTVLLMENRKNGIGDFLHTMPKSEVSGKIGSIVMNCNPFTLGHRYLIESAARQCSFLYVFVVAEDKSRFSFSDRFEMVRQGTADLENVCVLSTGPYLVSSATFPTYFLKNREEAGKIQCLLDVAIFTQYFVPKFSITDRFVGTEPLSPMTNQYNEALKEHLPQHGVTLNEIPRLSVSDTPVSASEVRRLIEKGDAEKVKKLVPTTTFQFLKTKKLI